MIVGFDISTRRIDWAWISSVHGCPMCEHRDLGSGKAALIDRVQNVRYLGLPMNVTEACIEYPYSVNRQTNASLMAVVGAVTARVPSGTRVSWVSSQDLRAAIGAVNTKEAAHDAIRRLYSPHVRLDQWDEHELDALVAMRGWENILNAQETA